MSQNTSFLAMEKDVTERLNKVVSSAYFQKYGIPNKETIFHRF